MKPIQLFGILIISISGCQNGNFCILETTIQLVDQLGTPVENSAIIFDQDSWDGNPHYWTDKELSSRSTDRDGKVKVNLLEYKNTSDEEYFFRIIYPDGSTQILIIPVDEFDGTIRVVIPKLPE